MSTEGMIGSLIILVAGMAFLVMPFLRRGAGTTASEIAVHKERESLLTAYERVLAALRDLDEDFQIGKLPAEAHAYDRARWAEQGAKVLAALEQLDGGKPSKRRVIPAAPSARVQPHTPVPVSVDDAVDAAIEQAVANYARSAAHNGE